MPYTPIHWSLAYLGKAFKPSLSLPGLLVSTSMPDLEIPFVYAATGGQCDRLVLHSVLGAATLATFLSVVTTVFIYSPIISRLFKLNPAKVTSKCLFSGSLIAVCFFGSFSHVLTDSFDHLYSPLFFPFTYDSFSAYAVIARNINNWALASAIAPLSFLALSFIVVLREVRKGTKNIWFRLLVG